MINLIFFFFGFKRIQNFYNLFCGVSFMMELHSGLIYKSRMARTCKSRKFKSGNIFPTKLVYMNFISSLDSLVLEACSQR